MDEVLKIEHVTIEIQTKDGRLQPVQDVSLSLKRGEVLALVGQSGCGKSILCKSILRLLPKSVATVQGNIFYREKNLLTESEKELCAVRGNRIAMVFQDPMGVLDPSYTVGEQVAEAIKSHGKITGKDEIQKEVIRLMEMVGISHAKERAELYPSHFSGGMRQRLVLAIALAMEPEILIADEPTTALDVTIQAQILSLMKQLQKKYDLSVLFVSHDLRVVSELAERVAVMKDGRIIETAKTEELFQNPKESYTKALIEALPRLKEKENAEESAEKGKTDEEELVQFSHITKFFPLGRKNSFAALDDVTFSVKRGEIFGLVGESGSGKSTLAKCLMGVCKPDAGTISFGEEKQVIFQDSTDSLNPRMKVCDIVAEPMRIKHLKPKRENLREEVAFQLKYVGLPKETIDKYPMQLSGGERQRVAIARALVTEPSLLVADEPLASLDVFTQMQIVKLFCHLREEHGFTILFIAHDLVLVKSLCDRIGVMKDGKLVEVATPKELFEHPKSAYTRALLEAIPGNMYM